MQAPTERDGKRVVFFRKFYEQTRKELPAGGFRFLLNFQYFFFSIISAGAAYAVRQFGSWQLGHSIMVVLFSR